MGLSKKPTPRIRTLPVPRAPHPWALWYCAGVLLVATTVAFSPGLNAQLLSWDDESYVSENVLLRNAAGLGGIWNPAARGQPQFYPLLFTTYWLEYQTWGARPAGYHVMNLVLHLANVVLVILLVRRLGTSAWTALGAAAIFALHPTQVASVVWVAERKNVLSGFFYLLAFLLFLAHRSRDDWRAYGSSLGAFVAALLSKTQTVTLPGSLLATEWLLRDTGRLRRVSPVGLAARLAPMLALGAIMATVTNSFERASVGASWFRLPAPAARPFIAATAPWFYVATFLAPVDLSPIYPMWSVSPTDPTWWLALLAWPLVGVALYRWRVAIGALPLWGLAQFCICLIPVIGLVPFGYQQHTLVADHYLYLANIGAAVALASWADRLAGAADWTRRRRVVTALGLALCVFYVAQSYREASYWHDTPTFWQRVLERNPTSFAANYSLGNYHRERRNWPGALPYYRTAYAIRGDHPGAFRSYTKALRATQGEQVALALCNAKLQQDPKFLAAYLERATSYEQLGNRSAAIEEYRQVLRLAPPGSEGEQIAQRNLQRLHGGMH